MTGNRRLVDRVCSGTIFIDWRVLIRHWVARLALSYSQMKLMEAGMGLSGFGDFSY